MKNMQKKRFTCIAFMMAISLYRLRYLGVRRRPYGYDLRCKPGW